MALDDLNKKATDFGAQAKKFAQENSAQIQDALKSEKAEQISDAVLDKVSDFANNLTGGKHSEKIEKLRQNLDGKLGNE